eukprot:5459011-Alexandrium_andersonii.AAC.1
MPSCPTATSASGGSSSRGRSCGWARRHSSPLRPMGSIGVVLRAPPARRSRWRARRRGRSLAPLRLFAG